MSECRLAVLSVAILSSAIQSCCFLYLFCYVVSTCIIVCYVVTVKTYFLDISAYSFWYTKRFKHHRFEILFLSIMCMECKNKLSSMQGELVNQAAKIKDRMDEISESVGGELVSV